MLKLQASDVILLCWGMLVRCVAPTHAAAAAAAMEQVNVVAVSGPKTNSKCIFG